MRPVTVGDVLVVATGNLRPDELPGWTVFAGGELAFRVATGSGVVRDAIVVVPPPPPPAPPRDLLFRWEEKL